MVRVSARARTSQEANQLGGAVILPLIFLAVGQSSGLLLVPLEIAIAVGAVLWVVALAPHPRRRQALHQRPARRAPVVLVGRLRRAPRSDEARPACSVLRSASGEPVASRRGSGHAGPRSSRLRPDRGRCRRAPGSAGGAGGRRSACPLPATVLAPLTWSRPTSCVLASEARRSSEEVAAGDRRGTQSMKKSWRAAAPRMSARRMARTMVVPGLMGAPWW